MRAHGQSTFIVMQLTLTKPDQSCATDEIKSVHRRRRRMLWPAGSLLWYTLYDFTKGQSVLPCPLWSYPISYMETSLKHHHPSLSTWTINFERLLKVRC